MAVISPIKTNYSHDTSRHGGAMGATALGRSVRLCRVGCAAALVLADLCAFVLAIVTSATLVWQVDTPKLLLAEPLSSSPLYRAVLIGGVLLVGTMLFFAGRAHYRGRIPFWSELRDVLLGCLIALLCDGFVQYALQRHDSRLFLGMTWVLFAIALLLARTLARNALASVGVWQLPAVVVGWGTMARQAESALLSEPRLGYRVVSVVSPDEPGLLHGAGRWARVMRHHGAELLVLALDDNGAQSREITESLVRERVPFAAMPSLCGLPVLGFEQTCFFSYDTVMFSYRNNLERPVARITKLVFDIVAATGLLIVLLPVLLAIAAVVKMDGGPVLYAHRRVGANGREFDCLKFRSMVIDSDTALRRLLDTDPVAAAAWSDTRKLRDDPRVTWIGRLLRSASLDELPQLFNVLRLEMSLVGPRPIVRSEVARYGDNIAYYYETRPGLTGLWQVSGRSETSYQRRVELDTWYVKNWTIWHDLAILAKTPAAVLKRHGAV